jgi:hypothetical protein
VVEENTGVPKQGPAPAAAMTDGATT